MSIEQGKGKGFLQDVLHYYDYLNHQRNYAGKNGKVVCSREYNQEMQKKSFFSEAFHEFILMGIRKICFRNSEYAEKSMR